MQGFCVRMDEGLLADVRLVILVYVMLGAAAPALNGGVCSVGVPLSEHMCVLASRQATPPPDTLRCHGCTQLPLHLVHAKPSRSAGDDRAFHLRAENLPCVAAAADAYGMWHYHSMGAGVPLGPHPHPHTHGRPAALRLGRESFSLRIPGSSQYCV